MMVKYNKILVLIFITVIPFGAKCGSTVEKVEHIIALIPADDTTQLRPDLVKFMDDLQKLASMDTALISEDEVERSQRNHLEKVLKKYISIEDAKQIHWKRQIYEVFCEKSLEEYELEKEVVDS